MNKIYKFQLQRLLAATFFVVAYPVFASPWLETDDAYLRSDLQLLADEGIVSVPVNSFPLPWREISAQIKKVSPSALTDNARQAYYHISYKINASKKGYGHRLLKLKASQKALPSSFGQKNDAKWGAMSSSEVDGSRFSMRVSANYAQYHDKDDPQFNLDNSYFAFTTGKTNFFINTQAQWWSPSWLQSISAEQRVHPGYELGAERTFTHLPLLGDVYIKTGVSQLRNSDDWKYSWHSRLSVRPVSALELSLSKFDFKKAQNNNHQDDYQQLSMDGRLSLQSIVDVPLALYMQKIIDDSKPDFSDSLIGSDYSVLAAGMQMRFVFEYRHTQERYLNKKRYSVGGYVQMPNDNQWQLFLHHDSMDSPGNQLVGAYRFRLYKGMLSLSLLFSDTQENSDKANAGLTWEVHF